MKCSLVVCALVGVALFGCGRQDGSAVFFVPKGTERPRGNPGHCTLYDFNDMSCTGPECD